MGKLLGILGSLAGIYVLYESGALSAFGFTPPASASPGSAAPATGATNTPNPPTTVAPTPGALAKIYQNLTGAAVSDYNSGDRANQLNVAGGVPITTFGAWNFFLAKQGFQNLPSYQDLTGSPDPNTAMAASQYWNLIAPWISKTYGLQGLRGLGAVMERSIFAPTGVIVPPSDPFLRLS